MLNNGKMPTMEEMKAQAARMAKVFEAMEELNTFNFDREKFFEENPNGINQHIVFYGIPKNKFDEIEEAFVDMKSKFIVVFREVSFKSTDELLYDYIVHIDPKEVYIMKPLINFWWFEEFIAFLNDKNDPVFDQVTIKNLGLEKSWQNYIPENLSKIVSEIAHDMGYSPISFGLPPHLGNKELERSIGLMMPMISKFMANDDGSTSIKEDLKLWKTIPLLLRVYDRLLFNKNNNLSKELEYDKELVTNAFKLMAGKDKLEEEFYNLKNLETINYIFEAFFIMFNLDKLKESDNEIVLEIYDIFQELKLEFDNRGPKEEVCQQD